MAPIARIRHDIGKYVTLQQRFLADDPSAEDLREALIADLGATRRGPAGAQSIAEVWSGLADERDAVGSDPVLVRLDGLIAELTTCLPALPHAGPNELRRVASLAREVAAACRALGHNPG